MNGRFNLPDGVTDRDCNPYNKEDIFGTCEKCGRDILFGEENVCRMDGCYYCADCYEIITAE